MVNKTSEKILWNKRSLHRKLRTSSWYGWHCYRIITSLINLLILTENLNYLVNLKFAREIIGSIKDVTKPVFLNKPAPPIPPRRKMRCVLTEAQQSIFALRLSRIGAIKLYPNINLLSISSNFIRRIQIWSKNNLTELYCQLKHPRLAQSVGFGTSSTGVGGLNVRAHRG